MTGIVLGSGLNDIVNNFKHNKTVNYKDAGLPGAGVMGHLGKFVFTECFGKDVIFACGRAHFYEGHSARDVVSGISWLHQQGVSKLILTNAAGALHDEWELGNWMVIKDHLNFTGASPCSTFVDMTNAYNEDWRKSVNNYSLYEGVYAGMRGPQYETPAEIRMLRTLGADAVGMSTVLETIRARELGMKVFGLSCLTNHGAGMQKSLNHNEVIRIGKTAERKFIEILENILQF